LGGGGRNQVNGFLSRLFGLGRASIYYHPAYRLPLHAFDTERRVAFRRADLALWTLLHTGIITRDRVRVPSLMGYDTLALAHTDRLLASLSEPGVLPRIYGATDEEHFPTDEVLRSVRLMAGGTLSAAEEVLQSKGAALNLGGGFHHAAPDAAGGFCPVNDIAAAVAALRVEGFAGQVCILDFDAHPADGLAAFFVDDPKTCVASVTGSDWGVQGILEIQLKPGTADDEYLSAVYEILDQIPKPDLAFVIAGGDVLKGDPLGQLALSFDGLRERDRRVHRFLDDIPAVWLPGGGYRNDAWKALVTTAFVVFGKAGKKIPTHLDPLALHFSDVADILDPGKLSDGPILTEADLVGDLFGHGKKDRRYLGLYTEEGIEYALTRYGVLSHLRRLGYHHFAVRIEDHAPGERMILEGEAEGKRHILVDMLAEVMDLAQRRVLFIHWLNMRDPRAHFTGGRQPFPGQDVPGLGMAKEATEMQFRTARRLNLEGVALAPSYVHIAVGVRDRFHFVDAKRQGRFEALLRDTSHLSILELSLAFEDGRVQMDGAPYRWEASQMISLMDEGPDIDDEVVTQERNRVHFSVRPL
jgi:acetoin utilization deacetylase AcuC-like enzyme